MATTQLARPARSARSLCKHILRLPPSARVLAYSSVATTRNHDTTTFPPPWRPSHVLDEWVMRDARPISLRQLGFFGRTLTDERLISAANYVRLELPTRIAHRLRDFQTLPYSALTNEHIGYVYELYYSAFERVRKVPEIRDLESNERFCSVLDHILNEHLPVIPRLAMGVLEIKDVVGADECDRFMTMLLRSRISRRLIAQQHLALTERFNAPRQPTKASSSTTDDDYVGHILLKCNAKDIIERCAESSKQLVEKAYGPDVSIPKVVVQGHLDTTFPYILSHIEYIIGELLRNSIQAVVEQRGGRNPPPIEVLICEAAQHVIIRVSDQGGGVSQDILPYLWSFTKGPRRDRRLQNLGQVPKLAATMHELQMSPALSDQQQHHAEKHGSSLSSFVSRPPNLRLGMGLPMAKIYAEYWAGSLELHSLEGYGCDAFLQISRLGNKNEVLTTRASMDAI